MSTRGSRVSALILFAVGTVYLILVPVLLFSQVTIDVSSGPGTEVRCPWQFRPSFEGPEMYDGDEFLGEDFSYNVLCRDVEKNRQISAEVAGLLAFVSFVMGGFSYRWSRRTTPS
jgi:hypothetical protein